MAGRYLYDGQSIRNSAVSNMNCSYKPIAEEKIDYYNIAYSYFDPPILWLMFRVGFVPYTFYDYPNTY